MSEDQHPAAPVTSGSPHGRPKPVYQERPGGGPPPRRQYVHFSFYKLLPEFRRLPAEEQRAMLDAFCAAVEANDPKQMILLTYSCVGTRGDVDLMFWKISWELEALQRFSAALNRLPIAFWGVPLGIWWLFACIPLASFCLAICWFGHDRHRPDEHIETDYGGGPS